MKLRFFFHSFAIHLFLLVAIWLSFQFGTEFSEGVFLQLESGANSGSSLRTWFGSPATGAGASKNTEESQGSTGSLSLEEREIEEFRKKLTYPRLALEQDLEDDCRFFLTVAENGSVQKVVEETPCQFRVFSDQTLTQMSQWKFQTIQKKSILIPVRFRIHERN